MLLDDTSNRASDAGQYTPGQIGRDSYQDAPLDDSDGYQSQNPRKAPTLNDEDSFNSGTKQGRKDPEFQKEFRDKEEGGFAKQAGRAFGKAKSAASNLQDTPENREKLKEEAKERIRSYAKKKIKDKFGEEVKDISADAIKKAAKDSIKKAGKEAVKKVGQQVGKQVVKEGAKVAVEAGVDAAAETAIAGAGIASAGPTLGLGLLIALLLEIAMYLGMSDAIDCAIELGKFELSMAKADLAAAKEHHKKARFHAYRGAMSLLMGFLLLIAVVVSIAALPFGVFLGAPIMIPLTIYWIAGKIFPSVGLLQGLSKKLLSATVIIYDITAIILGLLIAAAMFWYVCTTSGLGEGTATSTIKAKIVDWWTDTQYASMLKDACTSIGKF